MKPPKPDKRPDQATPTNEPTTEAPMTDASAPSTGTAGLSRRDFVKLGAGAAVLLPTAGWVAGCEVKPPQETGQEASPDGGGGDTSPTESAKETTPEPAGPDPQDEVDPQSYDKGTEKTWAPKQLTEDKALFPLGVTSGVMTASSALLWGFAQDDKPKTLKVWRDATDAGKVVEVASVDATPKDSYIRQKVDGLAPGTWYHFAFFEGDQKRSEIGRFRTALVDKSMKPLTLAATSCTNLRNAPFKALELTATYEYDLFLQLGDMTYNDGAVTRDEFRKKWQQTLKDPGYRAVLPKTGYYVTWDDHEIANNTQLPTLPEAQKRAGIEAFFENTTAERVSGDRFWNSYRWGHTAEFFVLDSRGERIVKSDQNPEPQYISPEQLSWFQKALKDSPCHFKIVLNSVPMIDWSETAISTSIEDDRWQGHPKQRKALLDFVEQNKIQNVWWLSGDFHIGAVARIDPKGYHSNTWEILVGPGGNGPNPAWLLYKNGDDERKEEMFPSSQFEMMSGDFAATILKFDPVADEVHVEFVHHETKKTIYKQTFKAGQPV